ncbi:MAG: alanine--tRNA ligase [Flavobacteriaceae bacterium]|jgi:alanyl-tRNA synthetase|nr:alanine--tRNA ligase [Flavobacteriaceae bacterium]MBT3919723.1 alanine--tRNA ligase [Flavobacteriaceae bacterium]MBT6705441.1 alanine--tRNA ligase [Flavobacteriaceae bacterium]
MTSKEIRSRYLDFFKSKSHAIVSSAPMVIKDDPTLMFTNAGMNQFKEYFLGHKAIQHKRVADTQKCLRVSGKHNDLEEVGMDTYHHTMFEMLGNWSFGDYFKKEAIEWAWEFLTKEMKIDKDSLYVTIFEGDESEGLDRDTEAYDLWKNLLPEERIINGNKKDNFWEMGTQGPCGPCSEIHVDIRPKADREKVSGLDLVNKDHPQVVELWNLVFMQFNRKANGSLEDLPALHVDTGMGFERLCMVMQNVQSNYDTDVFKPLMQEIETITNNEYGKDEKVDIAIRVIADHVRAVAFSIADGQIPSNTGSGYVIRRILRRAVRYGFTFLGTKKPFIYQLVDTLSKQMGTSFPELLRENKLISIVIKEEEHSFLRTLDQGLVLLENVIQNADSSIISGKKAFEMYDTFGFPKDLTALILRERGLDLNEAEFETELQNQKERSRSATKIETGDWTVLMEDDVQEFIGYDYLETKVKIARYRKTKTKKHGEFYQVVFNLTPFYPEGGGQDGDKGYLESSHGDLVYIVDTKKENNLVIHYIKNLPKDLNDTFKAVVDNKIRSYTEANHSATHLLHQALRTILGTHVTQKGSMVHSRGLRFDFSHFSKVTTEELIQVEDFVNSRIREGLSLKEERNIPLKVAMDEGAIALFGEKYGDTVRTIKFGSSVELCGGTHVKNTKDIWHFILLHEGAVASGIRRIEAITGAYAKDYFISNSNNFKEVKKVLQNTKDPVKGIITLQEENSDLKKQIQTLLKEKGKNLKIDLKNEISEMNGINFLAKQVDLDANGIKDISFELGGEIDNLFLLLGTNQNGKALLSCYISKDLVSSKNLDAGKIIRELGNYIQGGGGGQPFFATAGGKHPDGLSKALSKGKDYIS